MTEVIDRKVKEAKDTKETKEAKDPFGAEKVAQNLKSVKHVIIVMSGKGGVGKSTVAANLASYLSECGNKVGLLDADIHGPTIPKMFGIEKERPMMGDSGKMMPSLVQPNLGVVSLGLLLNDVDSPVIWRGPVKMGAIRQFLEDVEWGERDYLIIDLPPGTGDEPLTIAQLLPKADGVVIVTTPQDVALVSVRKSIKFAGALKLPVIGIIENMSGFQCPHCGKDVGMFRGGGAAKAASDFNISLLGTIPIDPVISYDADDGKSFIRDENCRATSAAFKVIADGIMNAVGEKAGCDGK